MTLRELFWMAEARQRDQWNQTAQILAMIYNAHRNPKARLMKPAEFHPHHHQRRKPHAAKIKDLAILRQIFITE